MTLLDKLSTLLNGAPQLAGRGAFELVLLVWIVRTWKTGTATLWPSRFGDESPLAFYREDEPRGFWTLLVLGGLALALGTFTLIGKIADLLR